MTSAAIYARVSSSRQKKDQTIGSQTQALRAHAEQSRLEVPEDWIFEDEGHSGATLVRPALEALRDLAAQGCVDVVLCYSPDRLARKFAYQAPLVEEFNRAGARVEFVKGPRGDSPEDQPLRLLPRASHPAVTHDACRPPGAWGQAELSFASGMLLADDNARRGGDRPSRTGPGTTPPTPAEPPNGASHLNSCPSLRT
jgi:hypothetical protein